MELVKVRARTHGKGSRDFDYMAVGKITPRTVYQKDGKTPQWRTEPVVAEDGVTVVTAGVPIVVDDVDASGILSHEDTEAVARALNLFGQVESDIPAGQRFLDAALLGFNIQQRKAASPVSETAPAEDELTPLIASFRENGLLVDKVNEDGKTVDAEGIFRRTVTTGSQGLGISRLEYVQMTPQYKQLKALGKI